MSFTVFFKRYAYKLKHLSSTFYSGFKFPLFNHTRMYFYGIIHDHTYSEYNRANMTFW